MKKHTKAVDCGKNITILGIIPVKKNKQRISRYGGIYKDPDVVSYETSLGFQAYAQGARPITGHFELWAEFHIRKNKDLDGVLTTLLDSLQIAGLIENDKLLRRVTGLEKIDLAKGVEEHVTYRINTVE